MTWKKNTGRNQFPSAAMPGVRPNSLLNKIPIFSSESGSQDKNNNTEGMKTEVRPENEVKLRNGHARAADGVPRRCESEPAMNWGDYEKKYNKIGKNGYSRKELAQQLQYMSVNDFNSENTGAESNGQCEASVVRTDTYAGRRDVSDPSSVQEKQIVSSRGTVRGFKNRVRAGIATFLQQQTGETLRNYKQLEKGKIVVFTTSMNIVRSTHERCKKVKKMLQTHMVRYEEKDLFMSKENQKELMERLSTNQIVLPQVFADGASLGTLEHLEKLNESGELRHILASFTKIDVKSSCEKCGGYRFIPCNFCHGSKKSLRRNHFTDEFCSLRCMQCDENGLLRCDLCLEQQE